MPVDSPAGVPIVGPGAPYITPAILRSAPTGISWSTIGGGPSGRPTPDQQEAEQLNICRRATDMVDGYCNQPLRATVDTETLVGPGTFRCQILPSGVARLLMARSPVVQVVAGQVTAAAAFPPAWRAIPANQFRPEKAMPGVYGTSAPSSAGDGGQAILLAPGWISWGAGRGSYEVQMSYINGWPHTALITPAVAGATSLHVDDITGWVGAAGTVYDSGLQEATTCTLATPDTAGAISGPGVLTLAAGLVYAHDRGTLVTALPGTVHQASILFGTAQALTRGATATTVQASPGSSGGGRRNAADLAEEAELLIHPFQRAV